MEGGKGERRVGGGVTRGEIVLSHHYSPHRRSSPQGRITRLINDVIGGGMRSVPSLSLYSPFSSGYRAIETIKEWLVNWEGKFERRRGGGEGEGCHWEKE